MRRHGDQIQIAQLPCRAHTKKRPDCSGRSPNMNLFPNRFPDMKNETLNIQTLPNCSEGLTR